MEEKQHTGMAQSQDGQNLREPGGAARRLSRRSLLALGLSGGGALALGVNGFAFWKRQQRALKVIQRMSASVSIVAWSPDGRTFAAGDGLGTVSVWTRDGQQVYSQRKLTTFVVSSLAWSPDGRYLVVGGDGVSHLWEARSGKSLAIYDFVDHTYAWSPNGRWIASGDKYALIQVWEPASGHALRVFDAYVDYEDTRLAINSIAWSPDSTQIATVGPHPGDVIARWNVVTGQAVALPFHEPITDPIANRMNAIGWSPDGRSIAAGYTDWQKRGSVALWSWQAQTKTWAYTGSAPAHAREVYGIAWSPDSSRFASVGQDETIRLWGLSHGLQIELSASDGDGSTRASALQTLSWSPDGKSLLAGDTLGQIVLWDLS